MTGQNLGDVVEKISKRVADIDSCEEFKKHFANQKHLDRGTPEKH